MFCKKLGNGDPASWIVAGNQALSFDSARSVANLPVPAMELFTATSTQKSLRLSSYSDRSQFLTHREFRFGECWKENILRYCPAKSNHYSYSLLRLQEHAITKTAYVSKMWELCFCDTFAAQITAHKSNVSWCIYTYIVLLNSQSAGVKKKI